MNRKRGIPCGTDELNQNELGWDEMGHGTERNGIFVPMELDSRPTAASDNCK
jgi:hypothetical protein